jgi:hypothetical protein
MTLSPSSTARIEAPGHWVEALAAASSDELGFLLRARPDLALSGPRDLAHLAAMMVSPASAAMYFEGANRAARQVLEALCALPVPVTATSLAGALGCSPEALSSLLQLLATAGMVLRRGDELTVNPGLAHALDWPCHLGPPAAKLLGQRSNSELARIAGRLGVPANGNKGGLLRRLTDALSNRELVSSLLAGAPAPVLELVESAAHIWPNYHVSYGVAAVSGRDEHPVGWCLQRGLLVGTDYSTAVMPREVAMALREGRLFPSFSPHPPELLTSPVDQGDVDGEAAQAALDLLKSLRVLCEAWGSAPAKLLQAGGVGAREVRRAAKLLARDEEVTARLIELAGMAGLVAADETLAQAAPTAEYDTWKGLSSVEQWAELASAWLMAPGHPSVAGSRDEDDKLVPPLDERELSASAVVERTLVVNVLAGAGPGRRVDVQSAAALVGWLRPSTWESEEASSEEVVQWVFEEAAMLGLCARGASSSFGRAIAGGDTEGAKKLLAELAPAVVDTIILQADFTATATGEPVPALRSELDLLADVESSGNATVWRFSEASLRRGFDAGRRAADIQEFLASRAPSGVPQALSYLVDDLGRRYGRVRVGEASSYVRAEDPSLLSEVLRDRRLASLRLRSLVPTVMVSERPSQEVRDALAKAGYLPASETAEGTLVVSRPAVVRARSPLAPRSELDGGGEGPPDYGPDQLSELLGLLDDLKDPGETDEEFLEEVLGDPDLLGSLTGLPADLARLLVMMSRDDAPSSDQDLDALVEKLRSTPLAGAASFPGRAGKDAPGLVMRVGGHPGHPSLFDGGTPR